MEGLRFYNNSKLKALLILIFAPLIGLYIASPAKNPSTFCYNAIA
jgi:hypothetical protein